MDHYQRMRRLAVAGIILFVSVILVFGRSELPSLYHERLETIGIMLIVIGIGGRLWSILYIGGRKSAKVVSTGPYSVTRNPLYVFSTIAAAGAGAQMGSVLATVGFALVCAVAFHFVILREEDYLRSRLGRDYEEYLARVPRFFPRPSLYRDQDTVTFRPRVLFTTLRDGLVFFIAMPLFELVEHSQNLGLIPIIFRIW